MKRFPKYSDFGLMSTIVIKKFINTCRNDACSSIILAGTAIIVCIKF